MTDYKYNFVFTYGALLSQEAELLVNQIQVIATVKKKQVLSGGISFEAPDVVLKDKGDFYISDGLKTDFKSIFNVYLPPMPAKEAAQFYSNAYKDALRALDQTSCLSIAIPILRSGTNLAFDADLAFMTILTWLHENSDCEYNVNLVAQNQEEYLALESILRANNLVVYGKKAYQERPSKH